MVCYARPASRLAVIVLIAWLVFARPVRHYFDNAALVMAVTVAAAGAVVAAALAFVIFMSVRRRRAAAGGCVSCQFRCQHAMTEPARTGPGRPLWLVTTVDRGPPGPGADHRPSGPAARRPAVRSAVAVPAPASAEVCGVAAPRWPDRPALRASQVSRRVPGAGAQIPQRERAGSSALAALARSRSGFRPAGGG
jgi:hypothetical protein